ncbi:MAG TPA: ABC transporter substrate-binding protein [Thermodesulfobacteriota bacterium]|nr:ABC transporter substrate-binding protein [Thermodesulfobacteriota bacterium]
MTREGTLARVAGAATAAALGLVWAAARGESRPLRLAVISQSASNWPLYVAQAKGFFAAEGLEVELVVTRSSARQLEALARGDFDVGHQAADHVIRAVEQGSDLFIVMALNRPVFSLVVAPAVRSFDDLRGRTLAVDGARTGYALLLKRILAARGLEEGTDYTLKEVGGTNERYEALRSGAAAAALVNQPFDRKLFAEGFRSLGSTADAFPHYQGSVAATRRAFAARNEATLVRYIRAYVKASAWLFDRSHRQEAIEILLDRVALDRAQAEATYEEALGKALIPRAAVNLDGLRQVVEVVWEAEGFAPPPAPPEKYVDLDYYRKATADL